MVEQAGRRRGQKVIDIPFCVAVGSNLLTMRRKFSLSVRDKISINSPALAEPELITRLADRFGCSALSWGLTPRFDAATGKYHVNQIPATKAARASTQWETLDWVQEVQKRGAG
ncbi:HisA/HisF-related TIM barrel protein [Shigella flexneri]